VATGRAARAALLALVLTLLAGPEAAARPESLPYPWPIDVPAVARPSPASTPTPVPTPRPPRPVAEDAVASGGTGELVPVPGVRPPSTREGRVLTYRVLVEAGLTVSGRRVDDVAFAESVHEILGDPRGWQPIDGVRFRAVDAGPVQLEVVLASPDTTDQLCAPLGTEGWLSCYNGTAAVLNARRWFGGAETYGRDLVRYRQYLVSHEVGHHLGHDHVGCPATGAPAPVMVQQTKTLDGCEANPWPSGG
jgi:hypothetical protein